jgi:hypothetical protein
MLATGLHLRQGSMWQSNHQQEQEQQQQEPQQLAAMAVVVASAVVEHLGLLQSHWLAWQMHVARLGL